MDRLLRVTGLSEGTVSMVNSVAFISAADFQRLIPESASFSYLLVTVNEGIQATAVAERIERDLTGVTAQTASNFARQERQLVRDMSTDIVAIMNSIGFLIGLAVLALTTYSAILSRRAEYGVLKALGARNRQLYRVVLVQTCASVLLGLVVGLVFVLFLAQAITLAGSTLTMEVGVTSIARVSVAAIGIAALAAVLPVRQIAGLEPAMVFRGASR